MPSEKKIVPTLLELTTTSAFKNSDVVRHYAGMNMQLALTIKAPSIGLLSKQDEPMVKRCITRLFIATSMYFDNELSQNKADVIAEELLSNYNYRQLKLEDILAICIEIKESDTFKLTPARILNRIAIYVAKREQKAIERSISQSQNIKSEEGNLELNRRIKKSMHHIEQSEDAIDRKRVEVRKFYK